MTWRLANYLTQAGRGLCPLPSFQSKELQHPLFYRYFISILPSFSSLGYIYIPTSSSSLNSFPASLSSLQSISPSISSLRYTSIPPSISSPVSTSIRPSLYLYLPALISLSPSPLIASLARFPLPPSPCIRQYTTSGVDRKDKEEKDLYGLIGASPLDGPQSIRSAYLRKAKELHPDTNAQCPDRIRKELLFKEIKEAYDILRNPIKRKEYDAKRSINSSSNSSTYTRPPIDDWYIGRDRLAEEFWEQVEQIRKEKERAYHGGMNHRNGREYSASRRVSARHYASSPAFALLRALPLLVVPIVLFFILYRLALARTRKEERPLPPIVRDKLGRAFFIDPHGRPFRVVEFDYPGPAVSDPRNT